MCLNDVVGEKRQCGGNGTVTSRNGQEHACVPGILAITPGNHSKISHVKNRGADDERGAESNAVSHDADEDRNDGAKDVWWSR